MWHEIKWATVTKCYSRDTEAPFTDKNGQPVLQRSCKVLVDDEGDSYINANVGTWEHGIISQEGSEWQRKGGRVLVMKRYGKRKKDAPKGQKPPLKYEPAYVSSQVIDPKSGSPAAIPNRDRKPERKQPERAMPENQGLMTVRAFQLTSDLDLDTLMMWWEKWYAKKNEEVERLGPDKIERGRQQLKRFYDVGMALGAVRNLAQWMQELICPADGSDGN
jgi:hypothetical protein